jgi:hypothetical protein
LDLGWQVDAEPLQKQTPLQACSGDKINLLIGDSAIGLTGWAIKDNWKMRPNTRKGADRQQPDDFLHQSAQPRLDAASDTHLTNGLIYLRDPLQTNSSCHFYCLGTPGAYSFFES